MSSNMMLSGSCPALNRAGPSQDERSVQHAPSSGEIQPGDWVWLELDKGYSAADNRVPRLKERRTGPYKVKKRVGHPTYRLDIANNLNIHQVVSVADLKLLGGGPQRNSGHNAINADKAIEEFHKE